MRVNLSNNSAAPTPKAPAWDFFIKDASLMPSRDLHPVDVKRWLEFVPAQHGPAQNGKRQNRWETILMLRKKLQAQMMSNHAVDYMSLLHEYGVGSSGVNVDILEDDSSGERDNALLIEEPIGSMKEEDADGVEDDELGQGVCGCTLTVHPISGTSFDYWAMTEGGPEIFHPLQDTTMVYLYLPIWGQGREAEFSMQDRIIWFDGNMVMAMAEIDTVHQDAIIVVNDGMIVPVSASFWPRALPPIDLEKSCPIYGDKETQAEYDQILFDKPSCPQQSKQTLLWQKGLDDRPVPRLANALGISLGNHVFLEVEEVMKKTD